MKAEIKRFFELARKAAEMSDFYRFHVGCLVTYKNIPLASGCNSNKTHPMQDHYNKYRRSNDGMFMPKLHAEIKALSKIKDLDIDFRKVKVFVYRIRNKDGKYAMARPCPSCMQAIKDMGIKEIYYTTDDGTAKETIE